MAIHRTRERWAAGEAALGAWLAIPSPVVAEAVARLGFDYVCIDLQHGLLDDAAALAMLQSIACTDATPFVRVPSNDFAAIGRALDAGALGVIVPMIRTADDVRRAVAACRYPPVGERSFGPTRAAVSAGPDYFARANDLVACVPMLETREAIDSLDEILAVPGVDAVYVGPNDLSLALGQAPAPHNPPPYEDAYRRIAKACEAAGIPAGIHARASLAAQHRANGFRMITVSTDLSALVARSREELELARG